MNLEWYSFDHSFLLSIDYRPTECRLVLGIDARMSIDHPRVHQVTTFKERFEEIDIVFDGVQYFRAINSKNLRHNPNDDIGSIEKIYFSNSNLSKETKVRKQEEFYRWIS